MHGYTAGTSFRILCFSTYNWDFIHRQVARLRANNAKMGETRPPRVLNLFAYTGAASLAARAAGADVTHLDSVRQVVTWARHNMEISSLVACAFGSAGRRTSGELVLRDDFGRILPLSVGIRLER